MAYKKLIKVSNVCQLVDKSKFAATGTLNGVTFHNNGDGSYTLNGTSTDYIYFNFYRLDKKLRAGVRPGVILSSGYYGEDCWYDINNDFVFYLIGPGETVNNRIIRPQIFDLTEMYGADHEPASVEQFRQDFPEEMYDYKPYCWLTSYKKVFVTGGGNYLTSHQRNLTCKTKNLLDINNAHSLGGVNSFDTFSINGNSITATVSNLNSNVVFLRLFLGYLPAGSYCFSCTVSIENSTLDFRPNEFLVFTDDGSLVTIERGFSNGDYSVNFTFNCLSSGVFRLDFYRNILPIPTESLSDTVYRVTFSNIQLELGSTATDYVPYGHL